MPEVRTAAAFQPSHIYAISSLNARLRKKSIQRCPQCPLEICRFYEMLPLFNHFILLRDFITECVPEKKSATPCSKSTMTS
jgi:hypothetical protein